MEPKRRTIFIIHPSDYLTDCEPHGDGLIAFGFIKRLAERGHRLHVALPAMKLSRPLPENVTLYRIPQTINHRLFNRVEYSIRVRRLFENLRQREPIELVHQMNPVYAGLSLAFAGCGLPVFLGTIVPRWPNDPDAVSSRNRAVGKALEGVRTAICAIQQQSASALLLTTPAALNRIPFPSLVRTKIHNLAHGIDDQVFSPGSEHHKTPARPTLLFLASLEQKKGIFVLLEAFEKVLKACPGSRLVVAGGGVQQAEVKAYVDQRFSPHDVELTGRVDRANIPALLRSCSAYCLPSFGEPYGTTLIEAMSCGKPIISTNAGGVPYMVPAGGAVLVPPGDVEALSSAIIRVLGDTALQASMGAANRAHVLADFTWERVVDRLERIYTTVVSAKNREPGMESSSLPLSAN